MALRRFLVGIWQGNSIPKDWREISSMAESATSFYIDDAGWNTIFNIIKEVSAHETNVSKAEVLIREEISFAEKRLLTKAKKTKTKAA